MSAYLLFVAAKVNMQGFSCLFVCVNKRCVLSTHSIALAIHHMTIKLQTWPYAAVLTHISYTNFCVGTT